LARINTKHACCNNQVFGNAMHYVALSRGTSFETREVHGLQLAQIRSARRVADFYAKCRADARGAG